MNIKEWFIYKILHRCPKCNSKLIEQGYKVDWIFQDYQCIKCKWSND